MSRFQIRGVIEGFYGQPWQHEQRLELLGKMSQWGLNSYMYAPKFDLRHRLRWEEPYSVAEIDAFRELVARGKQMDVATIFSISPGLTLDFRNEGHIRSLIDKFNRFRDIGANHLALLLDDIPYERADPREHAELARKLAEALPGNNHWYFCPTAYSGWHLRTWDQASTYLETLGEHLPDTFDVFWTGDTIVSRAIHADDLETPNRLMRRKVTIWDNFSADDYAPAHSIFAGPLMHRDPTLPDSCRGIMLNPGQHFAISLFSIASLAALCRDPEAYDPIIAWENHLTGNWPETAAGLRMILGYFYTPFTASPFWTQLIAEIENWFNRTSANDPELLKRLAAIDRTIRDDENLLRFPRVWMELYPHTVTLRGDLDYVMSAMKRVLEGERNLNRIFPFRERRWTTPLIDSIQRLVQRKSHQDHHSASRETLS